MATGTPVAGAGRSEEVRDAVTVENVDNVEEAENEVVEALAKGAVLEEIVMTVRFEDVEEEISVILVGEALLLVSVMTVTVVFKKPEVEEMVEVRLAVIELREADSLTVLELDDSVEETTAELELADEEIEVTAAELTAEEDELVGTGVSVEPSPTFWYTISFPSPPQ